jgi:mRNA export factor
MSFGSPTVSNKTSSIATYDCVVPQAGNDGISSLSWSPTANILVSSNWDSGIRCWEIQQQSTQQFVAMPKAQVNLENSSPCLDTCFSTDGSTVFSGGADKSVRMWQLGQTPPNNISQQIGMHDAPVKSVGFIPSSNLVVSGGWDAKLKVRIEKNVFSFVLRLDEFVLLRHYVNDCS